MLKEQNVHNQTYVSALSCRIALIALVIICVRANAHAADGQLDPKFGNAGKVRTDLHALFDIPAAVAIQRDGKIVVAGSVLTTDTSRLSDFAITRYNVDGTLDPRFGSRGVVQMDFKHSDDRASAVAILSNGKIIIAGTVNTFGPAGQKAFALIRLNPDGTLDLSFGVAGWAFAQFDVKGLQIARAMVIQRDGKIVVGGSVFDTFPEFDFALVRFSTDGSIDPSFGMNGKVIQDFEPGSFDQLMGLALQRDDAGVTSQDKIIAVGSAGTIARGNLDIAIACYRPDGSLDPTFGSGGLVTTDIKGANDSAHAVVVQADRKIVIAGTAATDESSVFALARYNSDGSLDPHFGGGGIVTTSFPAGGFDALDGAHAVAIQADGKIIAVGDHSVPDLPVPGGSDFALARYQVDGSLDPSFGTDGLVLTDFRQPEMTPSDDLGVSVAIQPDGKIVVAGTLYTNDFSDADFGLARYLSTSTRGTF
jgi:uncharacterized delta-60 repeat protein